MVTSVEVHKLRTEIQDSRDRLQLVMDELKQVNADFAKMEYEAMSNQEKAALAVARVADLEAQVGYLKEQVQLYQVRMGLIIPVRIAEQKVQVPLRKREPFAVAAARIQSDIKEKYWREKADAANIDGVTSEATKSSEDTMIGEENA